MNVTDRRSGAIRTRNKPVTPSAPYQSTAEKGTPGGYASLAQANGLVPTAQLGTGSPSSGTALLGDGTWGDVATQAELNAEASTRAAADTSLQANITAEASTRAAADTTLQANITSEATARAAADTTLQTNITAEATARAAADGLLQPLSAKGAASGYASLNGAAKVVETALKADILATARNIGGVSFDGSAAITPGTSAATASTTMARDGSGNTAVAQLSANIVQFPATQVPSADPNAFDDYEEGAWTPTIVLGSGSVTYSTQDGTYTKKGREVTVTFILVVATATLPSSSLAIGGLPFTAASGTRGAVPVLADGLQATATTALIGQVNGAATTLQIYKFASGGLSHPGADVKAGTTIQMTATYFV